MKKHNQSPDELIEPVATVIQEKLTPKEMAQVIVCLSSILQQSRMIPIVRLLFVSIPVISKWYAAFSQGIDVWLEQEKAKAERN